MEKAYNRCKYKIYKKVKIDMANIPKKESNRNHNRNPTKTTQLN